MEKDIKKILDIRTRDLALNLANITDFPDDYENEEEHKKAIFEGEIRLKELAFIRKALGIPGDDDWRGNLKT